MRIMIENIEKAMDFSMYFARRGCTLSAEKFFQRGSAWFLFVSVALFGFLYGVLGSVFAVLRCASMLVSVTFYVGMRDVFAC